MKFHRSILAAVLAGLLALGAVACDSENGDDDALIESPTDDAGGTDTLTETETDMETEMSPSPTDT